MRLPDWFAVHRWLGLAAAFFLFAWIVSGVVLLLPGADPAPPSAGTASPPPAAEMTLSPAEAVQAVSRPGDGAGPSVASVRIHQVGGRPAYRVATGDGSIRLVDARTGEAFGITRELAVRVATDAYPDAAVREVERLDSHGLTYPYGPLPAYRVVFDDRDGTWAHVAGTDGALSWSDREWRIRAGIVAFHEFSFLPALPGGGKLRWLLLAVGVAASTGVLATGLYLFYVRWVGGRRTRGRAREA